MVLLHNSVLWKHAPQQLFSMISCREWCCELQRNFWKAAPLGLELSKCCEDSVSQPINGISSVYFLLFFLCWCHASSRCVVQCHTFCHGQQKSPKKKVLHSACWALRTDCTMHRNFSAYCPIFFPEIVMFFCCCWHDLLPWSSFSALAWWSEVIENGSCLTRKWCSISAGTELNAMTGQLV